MMEKVILVDEKDNELGVMDKMEAHMQPTLHRAFSVFLVNDKNEVLLQKRAIEKYHCGGMWTNTCCSHPRPGEDVKVAANRRLEEEMGINCVIVKIFDFIYEAKLPNGLYEYEFDHVFWGSFSGIPNINTAEVEDWKYMNFDDLEQDVTENPENYTPWFKIILKELKASKNKYITT